MFTTSNPYMYDHKTENTHKSKFTEMKAIDVGKNGYEENTK